MLLYGLCLFFFRKYFNVVPFSVSQYSVFGESSADASLAVLYADLGRVAESHVLRVCISLWILYFRAACALLLSGGCNMAT